MGSGSTVVALQLYLLHTGAGAGAVGLLFLFQTAPQLAGAALGRLAGERLADRASGT